MLFSGAVKQPSKMLGHPNSHGRLSLNLLTDPKRSTKIRGNHSPGETGKGFSRLKKRKKKERESEVKCVG